LSKDHGTDRKIQSQIRVSIDMFNSFAFRLFVLFFVTDSLKPQKMTTLLQKQIGTKSLPLKVFGMN